MRPGHAARWVLTAVLAAALACARPPASEAPPPGGDSVPLGLAPDFTLADVSGQPLRLSAYRGKVVLLDFWATCCAPCREEMPHFVPLQNKYRDAGLQIIGISLDDEEPPVHEFVTRYGLNFPIAMGSATLAKQYGGILGMPVAFLLDREGRIQYKHEGQTDELVFDKEIAELLARR